MSFLKSLFGLGPKRDADATPKVAAEVEHAGFLIRATPYLDDGQYQTAGTIEKEIGGERKVHRFVRADRFASLKDAANFAIFKGKRMVDEQGERLFP